MRQVDRIAVKSILTGLVLALWTMASATAQDSRAVTPLSKAMVAIEAEDWASAAAAIKPTGPIGQDIVEWFRLRRSSPSFSAYQEFLKRRPDWPGLALLRRRGELSIPVDANPQDVITYFAPQAPATGSGALRLIAALRATGQSKAADALAIKSWTTLSMGASEETAFVDQFGDLLKKYHAKRVDMLLWDRKTTEATRILGLVSPAQQKLFKARIGLIKKSKGVDGLISAVPKSLLADPGLAYERLLWRAAKGRDDGVLEIILSQSTSADALGRPEKWSSQRRRIARQLMRDGKAQQAYDVASNHYLKSGNNFADLEWLAGFIALTDLKKPQAALTHFERFRVAVNTPISLGRAGYWEGRAYEALDRPEDARAAFEFGGEYQTSFYGQLAAEKAGLAMDPALVGQEVYPDFRENEHWNSSVMQAAMLFHEAGEPVLFSRFTRKLAESLNAQERGSLAQFALDIEQPFAALYVAKYSALKGTLLVRPYFPVTDIGDRELSVSTELALAIARRESEFYAKSKSPAGALGLMQLMPGTAEAMAKKIGVKFSVGRLTDDPDYNAALGTAYLAELIQEFGTAMPMVAAGYNAGPGRPRRWAQDYGDPRASDVDAVDWIEHIPFRETRNYVMRVMESLPIYRARLSGKTAPLRLSDELKGRY